MLTLIHGDDTTASRNYYLSERQKAAQKKIIDGATITLTDLMQIFSGNGLFGDQETIFIEELVSKRKSQKDIEELVEFLVVQNDTQVFLWESKLLTPKQVGLLKKAVIKEFKIPTVVFSFLDSIRPGNSQQMIKLYHDVLEHEDAGYVLVMLIRQIRILLALSEPTKHVIPAKAGIQEEERSLIKSGTISEVSRMAPWQQTKLQKQANLFKQEQLLKIHQQLFNLEKAQKTGTLTIPLPNSIDFFLLGI